MEFDLAKEIYKATEDWKMEHSAACPGGVKDGIYTQEFRYHWGSNWVAINERAFGDSPIGRGRTEQEAIDDLKEKL